MFGETRQLWHKQISYFSFYLKDPIHLLEITITTIAKKKKSNVLKEGAFLSPSFRHYLRHLQIGCPLAGSTLKVPRQQVACILGQHMTFNISQGF